MLADSHDLLDTQNEFDVVIVGSGYGGSITAARLGAANHKARRGLKIALLERGREHPVGTFPEHLEQLGAKVYNRLVNPFGLFEYIPGKDIDVIKGSGLGGTSLINANVAIRPDPEIFVKDWPKPIAHEAETKDWWRYYERAEHMLDAIQFAKRDVNPLDTELTKIDPFRRVGLHAGEEMQFLNITVSNKVRTTRYNVAREACTNCGNCLTGCNVGAKNTLAMNYLPMAKHFGVKLITQVDVEKVEKHGDGRYRLICRRIDSALVRKRAVVVTKSVILCAGSLGTTGILLRSADDLDLPRDQLGKRFSGNGDFIALAYNTDAKTDFQGHGTRTGRRAGIKAGPTITTMFQPKGDQKKYTVQDLSCPGPLVDALRSTLHLGSPLTDPAALDTSDEFKRWWKDYRWNTAGAFNHTIGFLIMGQDMGKGIIKLKHDQPVIDWQGAAEEEIYKEINGILEPASKAVGGTYITNPRWRFHLLGRNLVTAHPLGGCATANNAGEGVVDHLGRVFDNQDEILPGLYVADGSVIPEALGVNPFLTISAFTERMVDALRTELNLPPYDVSTEQDDVQH